MSTSLLHLLTVVRSCHICSTVSGILDVRRRYQRLVEVNGIVNVKESLVSLKFVVLSGCWGEALV
jgi:hypothetical protein